jgi:epidermal growth factor receptor substrate 15
LDGTKNERATVEQTLATQASQLSALQTQLSSAKAAYETETKLLATFRDRHSSQTAEMQKSREELIRAESDLSALRVEKSEIEGAFLRDKEEARDLHRKMIEVGHQVESLKSEIEKVKKDAKQQKGLLAIAKKQLISRETEKAKIEKELEAANAEVTSVTKELEEAESDLAKPSTPLQDKHDLSSDSLTFAASHALPVSPDPSSPAGSVAGKSNNPFERLALSPGTSSPRSQSPFVPFGDASQPAASAGGDVDFVEVANKTSTNDPFGFSEGFELDSETQPSTDVKEANGTLTESGRSTPRPDTSLDSVRSPASTEGSDQYVTPPTTANNHRAQTPVASSSASPAQQDPTVEDAASHFPDIGADGAIPGQSSGAREEDRPRETDLAAPLTEIEVEESDSESDSEDEVPLAELAKTKSQDNAPAAPPSQGITVQPKESFDDIFGVTPPTAAGTSAFLEADTKDAAVSSIIKPSTNTVLGDHITSQSEIPTVAGVSAFDEAMGIIPNTATRQFSFDSAFDDNFDFASATQFPPAPTPVADRNKNNHFDNVFTTPTRNGAPAASPHNKPALVGSHPPIKAEPVKTTFDEAFLGFDSGPTLDLENSFSSPTRQVTTTNLSPAQAALPVSSPPVSPKFSSSPPTGPVSPTPRARSPPPRVSSPKPRPSTSSSKETPDKLKEPPTRHSKLSVRIPIVLAVYSVEFRNRSDCHLARRRSNSRKNLSQCPPPSFLHPRKRSHTELSLQQVMTMWKLSNSLQEWASVARKQLMR